MSELSILPNFNRYFDIKCDVIHAFCKDVAFADLSMWVFFNIYCLYFKIIMKIFILD